MNSLTWFRINRQRRRGLEHDHQMNQIDTFFYRESRMGRQALVIAPSWSDSYTLYTVIADDGVKVTLSNAYSTLTIPSNSLHYRAGYLWSEATPTPVTLSPVSEVWADITEDDMADFN